MKYKIINKRYVEEVENEVNNLIQLGWEPLGGIVISVTPRTDTTEEKVIIAQAVIKKKNKGRLTL